MFVKKIIMEQALDELISIEKLTKDNKRLLNQIKKLESQRKRLENQIERRRKKILENVKELITIPYNTPVISDSEFIEKP